MNENYLNDDSIPGSAFGVINVFRERIVEKRDPLLIDEFFSEIHALLKDSHMRELARIRNEHSVEIMKLRKQLEGRLGEEGSRQHTKENYGSAKKAQSSVVSSAGGVGARSKFDESEIEKQRRLLVEENDSLKKRVRAIEALANSQTQERVKFMEGASWAAGKAHVEAERHIMRLQTVAADFERRSKEAVVDESIGEVDGRKAVAVWKWTGESLEQEIGDIGERFETLLENVNYHLKEALYKLKESKQAHQ